MKTLTSRMVMAVLFWTVFATALCEAAEKKPLSELVRIDMAKSKVESLMKRGGAPKSSSMVRPKDGWEAKGSQNATLSTYAKNAEDRLNIYIEYAESYTVKDTEAAREDLYVFYDADERVQFMVVLETRK